MHTRHRAFSRSPLVLALGLALSSGAWSGTVTVAQVGALAPGADDEARFEWLSDLRLDATGQVGFFADLTGPKGEPSANSGFWRGNTPIVQTGDPAPGAGTKVSFAGFVPTFDLSSGGRFAYVAALLGTDVTSSNSLSIWRDTTLVARTGSVAPGAGSGVLFFNFSSNVRVNDAGQVAYLGSLIGPGVDVGNNSTGIWRDATLVARTGNLAPGLGGVAFSVLDDSLRLNAAGQVLYSGVAGGIQGIWRDSTLVARTGVDVPGAGAGVTFFSLTADGFNANGQVAYTGQLTGTGVSSSNGSGIWRDNVLIARTGQTAPGIEAATSFSSFAGVQLNAAGQVAYVASLVGGGVTASNDRGVWRDGTLIAREGGLALAPTSDLSFSSIASEIQLNAAGVVLFSSGLAGTGVNSGNDRGLYLGDGHEVLQAVREGDPLAGSSVVSFSTSGQSFNDKAQLAYTATLADGRSGIFLFTPALRWRSTTSGSWADAANWTLSLNPADVHDVTLDPSNSLTITGPSNTVAVRSLKVGTGKGVATLAMAGGRIDAESVQIGAQGVLSGTGSFGSLVSNQGVLQAERLQLRGGLDNQGTVRGATGLGSRLDTNLNNTGSGRVRVGSGETLQLFGKEHQNAGVVEVNGGRLETSGSFTNAKAGTVDLKNATVVAEGPWRNETGARLLFNEARLTTTEGLHNAGQVQVTSGSSEVFGAVVNEAGGQIILSGQGTTTFYDNVDAQKGSELRVSGGATAVFFGAVQQRNDALFSGSGLKYYEGGFSVGNSPGTAKDGGDVTFGLGNLYLAELGGTVAGTGFDHYSVAGTLTLGGALQIVSWDGFTGQAGQSFDLFDWGQLQGQFASVDSSGLQLAEGTRLDLSRLYVDGTVSVTAVPEPATWALWFSGLLALGFKARRSRCAAVCV